MKIYLKKLPVLLFLCAFMFSGFKIADNQPVKDNRRHVKMTVGVYLPNVPKGTKNMTVQVPIPSDDPYQKVSDINVSGFSGNLDHTIYYDTEHKNRMMNIYWDKNIGSELYALVQYNVLRKPIPENDTIKVTSTYARYQKASPTIPIDGKIKEVSSQLVTGEMNNKQKARAIYNYLVKNLTLKKSGKGVGDGDALATLNNKYGNAADYSALFVALCRSQGIPARTVLGWRTPAKKENTDITTYHTWAEVYLENRGWMSVDVHDGQKSTEKQRLYFGGMDADRIKLAVGRNVPIQGGAGKVNRMDHPFLPVMMIDGKQQEDFQFKGVFANQALPKKGKKTAKK